MKKKEVKNKAKLDIKTQDKNWPYLLLLFLITCFAFWPTLNNGFTNWDDPTYLINNLLIKQLNATSIKQMFTEVYFSNYQPLHLLSYAIEYKLFGLDPKGYHLVSILMHAVNACLVFWLIKKLANNQVAFITAALFALSPLRVESVAWASERKDLLYAMFYFAALITYINYVRNQTWGLYLVGTFAFFVLAVFSKAMAVSLVPLLWVFDFYLKRKFDLKCILEKVPFLILALIMGLVSYNASATDGSIDTSDLYTFTDRIFFAAHNFIQYIFKSIIPYKLSAFYQYAPKVTAIYYGAFALVVLLIATSIYLLRASKIFLFTLLFFGCSIFLVLMLIPVGPTVFSERYAYIPSVALYFLIAWYAVQFYYQSKKYKAMVQVALVIVLAYFTYVSRIRCQVWNNSIALWSDVLLQFPTAPHALNNRGDAYFVNQQIPEAIADFNLAIAGNNKYAQAYYNRANAYGQQGKADLALKDLNACLKYDTGNAEAYNKRGQAYAILGNVNSALTDFNKALDLKPALTDVYYNLGITYLNTGQKDLACQNLRMALNAGYELAQAPFDNACK